MKKIIVYAFAAVAGALALASCQKEAPEDALSVSSAQITATAVGGVQQISFTTNTAWEIKSSAAWVEVSPAAGEAGDATVSVSIAANDTFEAREANITLTAGTKTTVWTVKQSYVEVFGASSEINISSAAQTIAITVNTNQKYTVSTDAEWISEVATKAAPVDNAVALEVKANATIEPRTAGVTIAAEDGSAVHYTVCQAASETALELVSVKYLGSSMDPYNNESYVCNTFNEYYFLFNSSKGQVALGINVAEKNVFAGEYEVDAAADHAAGTFSVKPLEGYTKYYTTIVEDGKEIKIIDGLVAVEAGAEGLEFSIQLMDEHEIVYAYTYAGAVPEIENDNIGAEASASFGGDYFTYFANDAQLYSISFYPSAPVSEGGANVYYISHNLATESSNVGTKLATGTFKFNPEVGEVESKYANGKTLYEINTFSTLTAYSDYNFENAALNNENSDNWDWVTLPYYKENEVVDGTVTIENGAVEGTYTFTYNLTLRQASHDPDEYGEPFTYSYKFENVNVELSDNHQAPVPDGDIEFTYAFPQANYMGWWYGDSYNNGGQVFIIGYSSGVNGVFSLFIPIQTKSAWAYEKNFSNRYCNTPVPDGVYEFAYASPSDGEGNAIDCIPNIKTKARKVFTNSYTGTSSYISGGSVTIENGTISFNVTAKTADGEEFHFTGGFAATNYYLQDYSAATRQTQVAWDTIQ